MTPGPPPPTEASTRTPMSLQRKLVIALGLLGMAWLIVLVFWGPAPFAFTFDDAYYYFTIGRNWANGSASTFDLIDRTNGYHPLWQLIAVVPYLFGMDGLAAVRVLLVTQLVLWIGALGLVARSVATAVGGWSRLDDDPAARRFCEGVVVAAFVVLGANPYLFRMTVNGLESGVVVPIAAVLLARSVPFRGRFVSQASSAQRWRTGGLLALAFLARTDAVLLVGVLAVWCALDRGRPALDMSERIRRGVQMFAVPAVVIVTYLVVNRVVFGTALQISGTVKRLPITPLRALLVVVWAVVSIGVLVGARRPVKRASRAPATRRFVAATGFYAGFCVALVGYYATLQEVPYLWYFAPLALYGTWLLLLLVADLAEGGFAEAVARTRRPSAAAVRAPALVLLLPIVLALAWAIPAITDPGARSLLVHDAASGRWIDAHLPPDARIASWDAGAISYFAHRKVVNLDGVVNDLDWYDAVRNGRTAGFLRARDVQWVANHGAAVDGRDPDIDAQIRALFGRDASRHIVVVHGDVYDYTGTLDGSRTDTSTKKMGTFVYRLVP